MLLAGAAPASLHDNVFFGNGLAVGIIEGTVAATVRDNDVGEGGGSGLEIIGSNGNRIERNDFTAASDGGIVLERSSHNVLIGNEVSGCLRRRRAGDDRVEREPPRGKRADRERRRHHRRPIGRLRPGRQRHQRDERRRDRSRSLQPQRRAGQRPAVQRRGHHPVRFERQPRRGQQRQRELRDRRSRSKGLVPERVRRQRGQRHGRHGHRRRGSPSRAPGTSSTATPPAGTPGAGISVPSARHIAAAATSPTTTAAGGSTPATATSTAVATWPPATASRTSARAWTVTGRSCAGGRVAAADHDHRSAPALSAVGDAAFYFEADERYVMFECSLDGERVRPVHEPAALLGARASASTRFAVRASTSPATSSRAGPSPLDHRRGSRRRLWHAGDVRRRRRCVDRPEQRARPTRAPTRP